MVILQRKPKVNDDLLKNMTTRFADDTKHDSRERPAKIKNLEP